MPSTEYYELRVAVTQSNVDALNGSGEGIFPKSSFETLGRDVKKAKGKWFKKSNVNFRGKILDNANEDIVTLTDGEHVAIFKFGKSENYVKYMFLDKKQLKKYGMDDKKYFGGYRIIIK